MWSRLSRARISNNLIPSLISKSTPCPQRQMSISTSGLNTIDKHHFRLRRLSDNLEYTFHHHSGSAKAAIYTRSDAAVRIIFDADFGWSTWDALAPETSETSRTLTGRVWDVSVAKQGEDPTEGVWVSRKGEKSYVYVLEYLE
jgi:hypothetical protein